MKNIHFVNSSLSDLRPIWSVFEEAYKTGVMPEDFADLFSIEILVGYNPDGSNRMIIKAA